MDNLIIEGCHQAASSTTHCFFSTSIKENRLGRGSGITAGKLWEALQHPGKQSQWIVQERQSRWSGEKRSETSCILDEVWKFFDTGVRKGLREDWSQG